MSVPPPAVKLIDHEVVFGFVEGEDRGANPMNPPRKRNDPLFWLRDDERKNDEVISHLKKEADYFQFKTTDLKETTETIYKEHISHIEETDMSAPYRFGDYFYYSRTVAGLSYKIHCRVPVGCKAGDAAVEQVILDENALAVGKAHCSVQQLRPSESHDRVAYSVDFVGDELYTIFFLDTVRHEDGNVTFQLRNETVEGTNGHIVWGADDVTVFYTTKDAAKRDNQVWVRFLDSPNADVSLHIENDTVFYAYCSKSFDGRYLMLGSGSSETSEVHLLNLCASRESLTKESAVLVRNREKGVRYSVESHFDSLIIHTNVNGAVNNKIVIAPISNPSCWDEVTPLVPHNDSVYLEGVCVFRDFLVVSGRYNGLTRVWTMPSSSSSFVGQELKEMAMTEAVFTIEPVHAHDQDFNATSFRAVYSSMTTPSTWYDVCPYTHTKTIVKQRHVGGGFDSANYICERRFATAPDGTKIPMSIVHRKDLDLSTPKPCMLYGYGSYGICIDPEFSISYLPYLDRGMVYAIGHVRGGGEMGRQWYEQGAKYLTKRNTFQDFVSCAEELISAKITDPASLACEGRSAGGLLIGAVLNMRPDLFKCAIAGVPFVDVLTTMCDPSIPLTTGEWEEWGNPNEYKYFEYMKSYSPIDNVAAQDYPHLFIHAGLHDPRVAYWEPAKWAAKLRMTKTDQNDVLLKMEMDSGHFSASDRYKYWREMALQQAFVLKHVIKTLK